MDANYIKAHEEDDIFQLISELKNNIRLGEKFLNEADYTLGTSTADRRVLREFAQKHKERAEWCEKSIERIIYALLDFSHTPIKDQAINVNELKSILTPSVQPADRPHFTSEMIEFLDQYFWFVPKLDDEWLPNLKEI